MVSFVTGLRGRAEKKKWDFAPETPGSNEDGALIAVFEQLSSGYEFDVDLLIK